MKAAWLLLLGGILLSGNLIADDWLAWRGPNGNGIAAEGQAVPAEWNDTKNVIWKVKVPGRGHSSPTVVGELILLTTADEAKQTQSVIAYDRASGAEKWATVVNSGGLPGKIHKKNTHASPTVACNGKQLFATFFNNAGIQLAALSLDGKLLWQKQINGYKPKYPFGYAPSPAVYKDTVIVSVECEGIGTLSAFKADSGEQVWSTPRTEASSYSSPIVVNLDGRDQVMMSGALRVVSYDPASGKEIWKAPGPATHTCGTLVWDGDLVFASGGYPQTATMAINRKTGKIAWQNKDKSYEQSMLAVDGYLYALTDKGNGICWNAQTGEQMWNERLAGPVSASPILAGGLIYATNERGQTFVFKPNPKKFELVATNQLGDQSFPSPTICGNRIYLRHATKKGERQEWLYCIGSDS